MGEGQHCAQQRGVTLPQLKQDDFVKLDYKSIFSQLKKTVMKLDDTSIELWKPIYFTSIIVFPDMNEPGRRCPGRRL